MNQTPSQPASGIKVPAKRKRRRRGFFNFLLFLGIIAAIGLFVWAEQQRRAAVSQLEQTEQELQQIRESTQRRGTEVAQQVLSEVRALIDIPTDPEPTVATIIDVEALRASNEFYNKANNGDHLIITENRAILYSPERKIIIDVVPVQINQEQQQQIPEGEESAAGTSPSPSPLTTASPTPQSSPNQFGN